MYKIHEYLLLLTLAFIISCFVMLSDLRDKILDLKSRQKKTKAILDELSDSEKALAVFVYSFFSVSLLS